MLDSCPSVDNWCKDVPRSAKGATWAGVIVLVVWIFGFGAWAGYAPIEGAVVSHGSFVATGQNKLVQHLEGGIVRDILVSEGELVEKKQIVMRLDDTATKARLRRLTRRFNQLVVMQARLRAETRADAALVVPPELVTKAESDPELADAIQLQNDELAARRSKMQAEIEVLSKEIKGVEESIIGFQAQVTATETQLKLFRDERADKEELYSRSLIRRTDVLAVQRADARLGGELGQLLSRIADSRERIARANQQMVQIQTAGVQKAIEELRNTESEIHDLKEQINAAEDVVSRIAIEAPVRGIVVKLNYHTAGGVVGAGGTILELLPVNDELIIETRINPADISNVKEGQHAQVRIAALNQRMTPMIDGKVVYVSADAVSEQDARKRNPMLGGADAFVVRVRLDEADLRAKAHDFHPTPGMPADLFVKTGQRTFFQYLLKPVIDSFSNAFRES